MQKWSGVKPYINYRILCDGFGEPVQALRLISQRLQPLSSDQIRVKMLFSPINPSDLVPIRGRYAHRITLPYTPGYEGVGVIVEVGNNLSESLLGQRVLPLRGEGCWQQYQTISLMNVIFVPVWMSDITAAQMYINPLTVWALSHKWLKSPLEQTVVINAAASAVGALLAQFAPRLGFRLIAVVRHEHQRQALAAAGISVVVSQRVDLLAQDILKINRGERVDIAIDLIGGEAGTQLALSLRPDGQFIVLGLFSGQQVNWHRVYAQNRIKAEAFHLRQWNQSVSHTEWHSAFERIFSWVESGKLTISSKVEVYPFTEYQRAISGSEQQGREGKIVMAITP